MKNFFNNVILFSFFFLSLTLASCLKDKDFDEGSIQSVHNPGDGPKVIQLKIDASNAINFALIAVDNSNADTTIDLVPVTLATADPADQDIHVTLALDSAIVDNYNSKKGTNYAIPSSSTYTVVDPNVVIPKGSNTGYLKIKFRPSDFIGQDLALGFKIASINEPGFTISGNLGAGVIAIAVKNMYDGVYNASGFFTHPNPAFTGSYNSEWVAATSGPTSITFQLYTTVLFGARITLTVNGDNSVTVSSPDVVIAAYDGAKNYYTPNTKTFHLDFGYSGNTRHLTGTATYDHAR